MVAKVVAEVVTRDHTDDRAAMVTIGTAEIRRLASRRAISDIGVSQLPVSRSEVMCAAIG